MSFEISVTKIEIKVEACFYFGYVENDVAHLGRAHLQALMRLWSWATNVTDGIAGQGSGHLIFQPSCVGLANTTTKLCERATKFGKKKFL